MDGLSQLSIIFACRSFEYAVHRQDRLLQFPKSTTNFEQTLIGWPFAAHYLSPHCTRTIAVYVVNSIKIKCWCWIKGSINVCIWDGFAVERHQEAEDIIRWGGGMILFSYFAVPPWKGETFLEKITSFPIRPIHELSLHKGENHEVKE